MFNVKVPAVSKHLKNIVESGEPIQDSVVSILETTAADGKNYKTKYYNLDAIIVVGYRVDSYQATQFRIWATKTLKEFIIKGFMLPPVRPNCTGPLPERPPRKLSANRQMHKKYTWGLQAGSKRLTGKF